MLSLLADRKRRLLTVVAATGIAATVLCSIGTAAQTPIPIPIPISKRGPAHFADHTGNLPNEPLTAVAVDPFDDQQIYVGLDGFVFASDDAGDSWAPILSYARGLPDDGALNDTAVDAFDSGNNGQGINDPLADGVGGVAGTARSGSGDFGDDLNDDPSDDPDADRFDELPVGDVTTDSNATADDPVDVVDTTVPQRSEPGVRAFAFVPGSRGVFLVATPRGVFRTTNRGQSFERIRLPGDVRENDIRDIVIDPRRPSVLWIGTGAGLFTSIDGGASIERANGRVGNVPVVDLAIDVTPTGSHLLVGTERGLLRSRDGGDTFADMLLRGGVAFPVIHSVAYDADSDTTFAGTGDGLFVGVRGAAILERYEGMPSSAPTAISPDPLWPGGVAVAVRGGDGGVVLSDDVGLTVVDVDILPANAPTALSRESRDPTRLWVASERGLFRLEPGSGIRMKSDAMAAIRERFAREPDVSVLLSQALAVHGLRHDDGDQRSRALTSAWLPRITMRYDVYGGDATQTRNTFLFRDPSALPPILDPDQDQNDLFGDGLLIISPSQAVNHQFYVNLIWDLDRLIMNTDVLASARQLPLVRGAERRVVDRTRQLYVTRRRLIAESMTAPTERLSPRERVFQALKLQEVEAHLAGLTDVDNFSSFSDGSSAGSSDD